MGIFGRKSTVTCTIITDGHGELFDVEPEVYEYIRRLEWDLIEEKNKTIRAESERDAAKRELETAYNDNSKKVKESSMFVEIESTYNYKIVYHKETKVMYAVSGSSYNNGTFTLLVDADGKPMLYEGDNNENSIEK